MAKGSNTTRSSGASARSLKASTVKQIFTIDKNDILDRKGIDRIVEAVMQGKEVEMNGETGHDYIIKREQNGDITLTPKSKIDKDLMGTIRVDGLKTEMVIGDDYKARLATVKERLSMRIADLDDEISVRKYKF